MKLILLGLAILAGLAVGAVGLPAAFLTGPLLVAAIFAITNRPLIRFPLFVYRLAQSVIGVMLSFNITVRSLQTIAGNWVPVVALVLAMLVLTTMIGMGLRRFANLEPGTALLGTLPGGAGEMIAMSDSLGADVRLVTVMQYGRLRGGNGDGPESGRGTNSGGSCASIDQRVGNWTVSSPDPGAAIDAPGRACAKVGIVKIPILANLTLGGRISKAICNRFGSRWTAAGPSCGPRPVGCFYVRRSPGICLA